MNRNGGRLLMVLVLVLCVIFFLTGFTLHPESGIYDRLGIWPESGYHGAFPEEHIDLFTGSLCLKFLDIWLPGPNGFDLKIWRVYNSKVLRDRLASVWAIQAEPYSYCGVGWSMHMGRIHNYDGLEPIIEFPDGKRLTLPSIHPIISPAASSNTIKLIISCIFLMVLSGPLVQSRQLPMCRQAKRSGW